MPCFRQLSSREALAAGAGPGHTEPRVREAVADEASRLARCEGSGWHSGAGRTAAMIASMERLGWSLPSASEAIDDAGTAWHFQSDSPAAIVAACKHTVRRWRLLRIGKALPEFNSS